MPIRSLVLLTAAGVLLFIGTRSWSAPVPKGAEPRIVYQPAKLGTTWVYESGKNLFTVKVTSVVVKGDRTTLTLSCGDPGDPKSATEELIVTSEGVFRTALEEHRFDPPMCLLKLPAARGDSWPVKTNWTTPDWAPGQRGIEFRGSVLVAGVEKVTVPAGTFEALRVEARNDNGLFLGWHRWYAPGVGMVKIEDADNTYVLKSFTVGK
jgi:hypothetical protein